MPCLLSTTAKTAFRGIKPLPRTHKIVTSSSNTLRQYAATAHAKQEPAAQLPPNDAPIKPASTLTPAQTARAACKAVHIALKSPDTGLNRAFLIVNSLHFSNFRDDPKAEDHPLYQKFKDVAIKFDRPIPPGLASTALLHGLVRLGKTKDAARLAVQMMAMGLHLKPKTLDLVHKHLVPKSNPGSWKKAKAFPFAPNFSPNPKSLSEIAPMAQNESTRLALDLFALAENHQHQTKRGMFATLLTICLINGEIILASLLLGYFVKDAHSRSISTANAKLTEPISPPSVPSGDGELLHESYEPGSHFMARNVDARRILTVIDRTFARNENSKDFQQTLQSALQSLANLASLLEHKTVIVPELSLLIRTLYHVPRVDNLVWVCDENGQPIQVEAYEYFHLVLRRVIERLPTARGGDLSTTPQSPESLPTAQSGVSGQNNTNVSPDLHITVYNTLLHYTLRHQFSMTFAERILLHMVRGRESGPLAPPKEAFNIILRSSTLLQEPEVAQQAIAAYRTFYPHDVNTRLPSRRRRRTKASRTRGKESNVESPAEQAMELMTTLARSRFIKSRHTKSRLLRVPEDFLPENYALSNLIVHVTSTGSPQAIQNLVVAMFPELFIPLLPRNNRKYRSAFTPSAGYDRNERIQARNRAAIRGITYGPHVFSALLNALRKAGRTKLAWAVWRLALVSEKKSWKTREPWLLHISAYDSMLNCLAQDMREESDPVRSGGRLKRLRRDRPARRPVNLEAGESKALGAAWRLYKRMKKKGPTIRSLFFQRGGSKERWNEVEVTLQIPRPDARWFNSALELFILPTMRAKRSADKAAGVTAQASKSESQAFPQRTPDEVWTEFDHLRRINIETGYVSEGWNKLFQVIAEDMVAAGYPVPPGLRYLFIGRWETGMLNVPAPEELERTAYEDPWDDREKPFSPYLHSARPDKSVALRRKKFGLKEPESQDI